MDVLECLRCGGKMKILAVILPPETMTAILKSLGLSRRAPPLKSPAQGARQASELRDGQEVEIIAWRPLAPQGLSYQVRRSSDHREWWAKAVCLRKSASASALED